ncbi:MAG: tRNA (adenosine(37)-N6)-threonylcarbamoyltransferase complex ATPase subunit type 1 TsaE [Thermoleophilaceae bacterium]
MEGPVTSPTFTVGRLYPGRVEVAHLDLYRLGALADEDPGLLEDYLTPERIAFLEWPEAAEPRLGAVRARIVLEHRGGDLRSLSVAW